MINPYLIALDLDGTTLNNDGKLSTRTIQTLQTLNKQGHHVVLTTGRSFRLSKHLYQQIGLTSPMITCNGAKCHHPLDDHWHGAYHHCLPLTIAQDILALHQQLQIGWIGIEGNDTLYMTTDVFPNSHYFPKPDTPPTIIKEPSDLTETPVSFGWFSTEAEQADIKKALQSLPHTITVRTWGGVLPCLDIAEPGIHKAFGIQHLVKTLDIDAQNVIAFGDEHNDFEMIDYAPNGIAMANAIPELKAIATSVTKYDNHHDGVAHHLIDFFNLD